MAQCLLGTTCSGAVTACKTATTGMPSPETLALMASKAQLSGSNANIGTQQNKNLWRE